VWCGGGGGGARDTRRREGGESRRVRSRARGGRGSSGEARKRVTNAQSSTEQKASSARLSRAFASALLSSLGLHGRLRARVVRSRAKSPGPLRCRRLPPPSPQPPPPRPAAAAALSRPHHSRGGAVCVARARQRPRQLRCRLMTCFGRARGAGRKFAAGEIQPCQQARRQSTAVSLRESWAVRARKASSIAIAATMIAATKIHTPVCAQLHSSCLHMARTLPSCRAAVVPWSHRSTAANQCYLQLDSATGGA